MTRRSGLTLVEVLTALFIMALGTVAILTLFPFGAMQMGQAIRDSRSIESAFNADACMRTYWKTYVVEPNSGSEPFYQAMLDPDGPGPMLPAQNDQPSYPVAVDPIGFESRNGSPTQFWVGDMQTNLGRRNLNVVTNSAPPTWKYAMRLCSLMDTQGFIEGEPNPADRELRYNWLWILQMPRASESYTCNETIVVFDRRAMFHTTLGAEDVLSATVNPAVAGTGAIPGLTSVTFDGFNQETKIQPGTWICDATVYNPGAPAIGRPGMRNANFYRVVSVNGNTVELQTPIMPTNETNQLLKNNAYTATFVVWRGVSGVFVKPPLKATVGN